MTAQHTDGGSFVKPPLPSQSELPKKEEKAEAPKAEAPKAEAPKAQEAKKDDVARELADVKKELAPVRAPAPEPKGPLTPSCRTRSASRGSRAWAWVWA